MEATKENYRSDLGSYRVYINTLVSEDNFTGFESLDMFIYLYLEVT